LENEKPNRVTFSISGWQSKAKGNLKKEVGRDSLVPSVVGGPNGSKDPVENPPGEKEVHENLGNWGQ